MVEKINEANMPPAEAQSKPTLAEIARIVCVYFDARALCGRPAPCTLDLLRSPCRDRPLVRARFAFCLLAREHTDKSLPQIARFLCRDHSTIKYAMKTARPCLEREPGMWERYAACVRELGGST